jgi:hypothetical protein
MSEYYDIGTAILFALKDLFQKELGDDVATDDVLRLKSIKVGELQDDPTMNRNKNNILIDFPTDDFMTRIWAAAEQPHLAKNSPVVELNGTEYWLWRIGVHAQLYITGKTMDQATALRSEFFRRMTNAIRLDFTLGSLCNNDGSQSLTGQATSVIEKARMWNEGEKGTIRSFIDMVLAYPALMWRW